MSISLFNDLPQALQITPPEKPTWIDGRLMVKQFVARDPLTGRAYFDAKDLTVLTEPENRYLGRRLETVEIGSHVRLSIHADMLKAKAVHNIGHSAPDASGGGQRGEVVGFSRGSRKRLIEFMASVRYDTQLIFLTLTYPDHFPQSENDWNAHFEAFRRRFERRFPIWRCIWRKEMKRRRSGDCEGQYAPHWHLLIWTDNTASAVCKTVKVESYGKLVSKTVSGLSIMVEKWALLAWSQIVASDDTKHAIYGCFACAVRNRRHAYSYVSKYIAKEDDDNLAVGRRWGRIGSFDTKASDAVVLSHKEYIEFRRLVRKWMKSRKNKYHRTVARQSALKGMTVFGLGDGLMTNQSPDYAKVVYRMIDHAIAIADDGIPLFQRE